MASIPTVHNPTLDTDPRGPRRTIVEVQPYRLTRLPNASGGCIPLLLDCGHVAEMNFTFSYKVGESVRCFQCRKAVR